MDVAQTVARAMALLELLAKHGKLSAIRMIELLGFHRSTAYRLLGTLQQLGYVRKDEHTGLYSLAPRVLQLSSGVLEQQEVATVARPFLRSLHDKTRETVHLALLEGQTLVYLDKLESTNNLRVVMSSQKGSHAPLYCTGIGKVLLAWSGEDNFRDYVQGTIFKRFTPNTLTEAEALHRALEDIRESGYALDREEHEVGVFCVAAPVRDAFDHVVAALSVSVPSARINDVIQSELTALVMETARDISEAISISA